MGAGSPPVRAVGPGYRPVTLAWMARVSPDWIEALVELATLRGTQADAAITTSAATRSQKCDRLLISAETMTT